MASLLNTPQISAIMAEIDTAAKAIQDLDVAKDSARKRALVAAKNLVVALESPIEMIYQHAFNVNFSFRSRGGKQRREG